MELSKGFKIGSPRGIFLVLSLGGAVSLVLLCATMALTGRQIRYSEAINNAGRLRYKTQRWGLVGLTETLLEKEPSNGSTAGIVSTEWAFEDVQFMCAALLGEHETSSSRIEEEKKIDPVLDSSIKEALRSWRKQLEALNEARPAASSPIADLLDHNAKIEDL